MNIQYKIIDQTELIQLDTGEEFVKNNKIEIDLENGETILVTIKGLYEDSMLVEEDQQTKLLKYEQILDIREYFDLLAFLFRGISNNNI